MGGKCFDPAQVAEEGYACQMFMSVDVFRNDYPAGDRAAMLHATYTGSLNEGDGLAVYSGAMFLQGKQRVPASLWRKDGAVRVTGRGRGSRHLEQRGALLGAALHTFAGRRQRRMANIRRNRSRIASVTE